MTEAEIKSTVLGLLRRIAPDCEPGQLDPEANLREAVEIDSFDFLNLLIALSEKLGVEIPESDYGKLGTLNSMVSYLAGRIAR